MEKYDAVTERMAEMFPNVGVIEPLEWKESSTVHQTPAFQIHQQVKISLEICFQDGLCHVWNEKNLPEGEVERIGELTISGNNGIVHRN